MPESSGALGIFGGTFDPPHIAHLRLAIEAREALQLTEVVLVPAGSPPLRDAPQASPAQRLAMVECAVADMPGYSVDASEIMVSGPSYTVATLARLRKQHGTRPLVLLMGADAFARLPAWQRWRELFTLAHIGVATRPGHVLLPQKVGTPRVLSRDGLKPTGRAGDTAQSALDAELAAEFSQRQGDAADIAQAPAGRIIPFAITPLEISATLIRQRLAQGLSVRHLVSSSVLDYIDSHAIYRTPHGH